MKSGFLLSSNPKVSVLSEKPKESDTTLGFRKYKHEDFDFNRNIGTGNFSTVWHVTLKNDPFTSYAIKSYNIVSTLIVNCHTNKNVTSKNQHPFVKQEKAALLTLNSPGHRNVIRLVDTFRDESHVYLIYEYAELELWELIKHCGSIFDDLARHYINQIIDGLEYIHSKGIVHRDLKCENTVISNNTLKIIDFGSSKHYSSNTDPNSNNESTTDSPDPHTQDATQGSTPLDSSNVTATTSSEKVSKYGRSRRSRFYENYVGTPNFMDPKSIANKDTGFRRDFWSLGCLIYQILCGRAPFHGSTEYFVLKRVKELDLVFPDCINSDAKDLIRFLLNPDETQVPTFHKLREHPFLNVDLNQVNFKDLEDQSREWREVCYKIGELLLTLTESRSPEITPEFKRKFDEHIRTLKDKSKHSTMHVMDRLIDLMFWSLDETKREIVNETIEADRWLS